MSPRGTCRSPRGIYRSPLLLCKSPVLFRRSPQGNCKSPLGTCKSPVIFRGSPEVMRTSPGLFRGSPAEGWPPREMIPSRTALPCAAEPGRHAPRRFRSAALGIALRAFVSSRLKIRLGPETHRASASVRFVRGISPGNASMTFLHPSIFACIFWLLHAESSPEHLMHSKSLYRPQIEIIDLMRSQILTATATKRFYTANSLRPQKAYPP